MLTQEQLLAAFNAVGVDTQAKVETLLTMATKQMRRNGLILARDQLDAAQAAAISGIEAQRQALTAEIEAETQAIIALTEQ